MPCVLLLCVCTPRLDEFGVFQEEASPVGGDKQGFGGADPLCHSFIAPLSVSAVLPSLCPSLHSRDTLLGFGRVLSPAACFKG